MSQDGRKKLELKDYLAIFIAALQTIFAPMFLLILVLALILLFFLLGR